MFLRFSERRHHRWLHTLAAQRGHDSRVHWRSRERHPAWSRLVPTGFAMQMRRVFAQEKLCSRMVRALRAASRTEDGGEAATHSSAVLSMMEPLAMTEA